jgi:hypothetical protein
MKKWLVGLVAAGLCAASAWATTVTYTVAKKAVTVTEGEAPDGSTAAYSQTNTGDSGQATAGNSMTLTLSGYEGVTITGLTLSMRSNASRGAGSLSATCGEAVIASIPAASFSDESWYGEFKSSFVPITPAVTATAINDDVKIVIAATTNSLYVESYTIDYTTEPLEFSISLEPAENFEVVRGEEASIKAVPQYPAGAVSYVWGAEGVPGSVEGNVFTIDSSEIGGPYTVTCDANDGTSDAEQQSVTFSIVAPPPVYDVEVVQSAGGTVSVEPASGTAGTEITVTADPDEGYRLVEILVDGEALPGTTFFLPENGATVSATFEASPVRTAIYTVASKTEVTESGDVPQGSSATYAQIGGNSGGQITGKGSFTLTLKGYVGATITGLTLSMKSNSNSGSGSLSMTCGGAVIASIADSGFNTANWHGAWSGSYVDVTPAVTPTLVNDDVVLVITGSENSLYCQSVSVTYEVGGGMFSVVLDPDEDFEVTAGDEATVTATARNALGEVTYAWTVDGVDANEAGNVLTVPTDTVGGPYEVVCTATDGGAKEGAEPATASVKYTVKAAPQEYTVTVDAGIENGSVAIWVGEDELESPASVLEGTTVKVVATPALRSWTVESILVTGATSGTTVAEGGEGTFEVEFEMPQENVAVAAAFKERSGDVFEKITTTAELEAGEYVITGEGPDGNEYAMLNEANTSTSTDHIKRLDVPVDTSNGAIAGPDDSIIWTLAQTDSGWTIHNAAAGFVCYVPNMGNSANVESNASTRSTWTIEANEDGLFAVTNVGDTSRVLRYNPSQPRFACYDKPASGKSLAFYKKNGPGTFSIKLDPAEDFEVAEGTEATITATPKNAQGEVTYEWSTVDAPGSAEDNVWTIPAETPAGGPWTVYCNANDGTSDAAEVSVSFSVVGEPEIYEVTVAEGIENGEVTVEPASGVAGTLITVTATPDDGYRCDGIYVNDEPLTGLTFELPEGGATVSASFVVSSTKTATYTVESTSAVSVSGTVPDDSEAVYASTYGTKCQLIGGTSMTLTLKGYEGATITGLILSMKSNARGGAGSLNVTCGGAVLAEIADAAFSDPSWNGAYTTEYVDIAVPVAAGAVSGDVVIKLAASANSIYCQSFTVEYEPGEPEFTVSLDANGFELTLGEGKTVTATAENGEGEITYSWSSETLELNGSGPALEIPGNLEAGEYAATVTATDSSEPAQTATAELSFKVVAPPEPCKVSIAEGIENGSVALIVDGEPVATPAELLEGTEVTVEATPEDGFQLEAITVNGEPIEGNTFTVAGDSEVSATFAKVVDYATLPFLAEDTPFTGPWKTAKVAGLTSEGLGNDYESTTEGKGARFDMTGTWLQIKFEGTPGELSYALKGQGTTATNVSTFDIWESATGGEETWTSVAIHKSGENLINGVKTNFTAELKADSRFVKFVYTEKATGNVALYDVYISAGGFRVTVDKNEFELEQGQGTTVKAEAKNGVEPYDYVWSSDFPELGGVGPELEIPGELEPGEYSVTVMASDASNPAQTAKAEVKFTVIEAKPTFTVSIAGGIENGEVSISVDGEAVETPATLSEGTEVTVVATPFAGFKTEAITVNGDALTGDTFTVTEDAVISASFMERGDEFVKITGLDQLEEGEYVITGAKAAGEEYAMLAQLSDGNKTYILRQEEAVEIENGDTIAGPDASIVWTVAKVADGWTIHNDAIGYVGYVASDNTAGAEEEASEKSTWTIAESSDGLFLLTNVGNTGRYLLYNASAPRFACYDKTSSGKALAFYKKSGPAEFGVTVSKTGFEVTKGISDSVTATAKNGAEPYSFVWASETEALNGVEGAELTIPGTLDVGEYKATVTATDSSAEPQTDTAEITFTVVAPLPIYTVTVAEGIENGTVEVDKTSAEEGETVTVTATPAENYKLVAILVNGEAIEGNTFEIAADSVVSATFAEIVLYPVTIDDAIEHGTVETDKTQAEAGETVTLTAKPDADWKLGWFVVNDAQIDGNSFEMPEGEAKVSAVFVERVLVTYVPVERDSEFVAGEEYLVVAIHKDGAFTSAMKNANEASRIGLDEVTVKEDGSIETDNEAILWTIRPGAEDGQVVLYNTAAGVYAAAVSDGNYAQVQANGDVPLAQWTLDLSEAPTVKITSVSYTNRWLQRNSTANNKYFAAYTGSQTTPQLFKKAGFSVGFADKEDGFTVEAGTADSITAEAVRGVEPYSYAWTGDLEGEGATLAIPDTLEAGEYSVTVTATDSTEPEAQTATADISFTVVAPTQKFTVAVDPEISNGEVTVDKATAAADEEVTVTATPADGFTLAGITVTYGDEVLSFDASPAVFPMPAQDVLVSATFAEVVDYATLPFIDKETPYPGPWKNPETPGLTNDGLDSDYKDGSAKFDSAGASMQIKFRGTPGTLSFGIKGNAVNEEEVSTFVVQESADGENWTPVAVFTSDDNLTNSRQDVSYTLSEDSRYVKFLYQEKDAGNVGIYDVYIGEAGEAQPTVTVTGETTLTLDDTFALALGLENYSGEYAWAWAPSTIGYVDADTATWWWTPTKVGETEVTFSAMDGDRTIASATVTLTVVGAPDLVFDGDDEGVVDTPVEFTVEAVNTADPTVTFIGFLDLPEGSALTDEDVVLNFPNVSFTPDVAGEYGLAFSAGTVGVDYVEDAWIVTVHDPEVVFDGDDAGTVGRAVKFSVFASLPGGTVDFENFILAAPEGSSLTEDDVTIDTETGEVSFTPDVSGDYEFGFNVVGGEELYIWTVSVEGEGPGPVQPKITSVTIGEDMVTLGYTGDATEVWGTDDLTETTDSWGPVEGATVGNGTASVQKGKHFLRLQ